MWQKQQKKGKKSTKKQISNKKPLVKDTPKLNSVTGSKDSKDKIVSNPPSKTEEVEEKQEKDKSEKKKEKQASEARDDGGGDKSDADESDLSDDEAEKSEDEESQTDSKKVSYNLIECKKSKQLMCLRMCPPL